MDIIYKNTKDFTQAQIVDLFQSVQWESANYPSRLYQALQNSSSVFTAWHNENLVGLPHRIHHQTEIVV